MGRAEFINLIQAFTLWETERCISPVLVDAVAVGLLAQPGGVVDMVAVSAEHILSKTCRYVAGLKAPECKVLAGAHSFETLYASFGVGIIASIVDGDCALDFMIMM